MSNSLASVHPELISEWSEKNLPLTPDKITFGSNKRVWWKGACGHEWETSVKARSKGEKCPICSGARVIEGINDLATLKPLLAQEWSEKNELKPTEVSVASHKKIIWKCKHGHEWEASVKSRTVNGTGCPYCSHNKVLAGFNDLASQYPDIAAEWSDRNLPLLPTMVTAFANSKAWWKCKDCGNEWHTLISTRSGGSRCPYCSGYTLLKGFNDLATTHPDLAAEWAERNYPLMPDEVNAKSRRNVWWKCKTCGNEWKSVINARVKGTVCPVCADRAVLVGYNDLATTDRKLLAEWDYEKNSLLPAQVSRRSMKSVWWKCSLGHSWKAKINERTIIGEKCTVCEKEYRSVFPGLAVAYYANQKGLKVQLGSDEYSANFLFTLWKRVRKYGAYATGITQNVDDLLQSHTARTMLANSEFLIMLNQASTDRIELAKLLNISDLQLSYITNVDAGHGLIKVGSSLVPFANKFPKNTKLYKLMTTKPGEGV